MINQGQEQREERRWMDSKDCMHVKVFVTWYGIAVNYFLFHKPEWMCLFPFIYHSYLEQHDIASYSYKSLLTTSLLSGVEFLQGTKILFPSRPNGLLHSCGTYMLCVYWAWDCQSVPSVSELKSTGKWCLATQLLPFGFSLVVEYKSRAETQYGKLRD